MPTLKIGYVELHI